jgi:hypothetical protein
MATMTTLPPSGTKSQAAPSWTLDVEERVRVHTAEPAQGRGKDGEGRERQQREAVDPQRERRVATLIRHDGPGRERERDERRGERELDRERGGQA